MHNNASYRPGPRVAAYALIGRDEEILFLTDETGALVLPGGPVRDGEPVEQALHRTLRHQIDATITGLEFCCVIEHKAESGQHDSSTVLAFLFDATLAENDDITGYQPYAPRWCGEPEAALLRPSAIADVLADGSLSVDFPWRAWKP
ncbi:NUDIX domain-containing protein [Amycolatopsis halotolerans]|uniref:NUDIX domain-containing protein n=1 Tax=Amycolatopsis halotolerans TaxID=330083 RepID=A0ABV7QCM2_9PSEU